VLLKRSAWVVLAALACSGPGGEDGGTDSGVDAGPAATDAGVDAGSADGGGDSGLRDGGVDDPLWEPWLELASDCVVERAQNPSATIPPRAWAPCSDGLDGCSQALGTGARAWFDGEVGFLASGNIISASSRHVLRTITRTSGPTLAAWRLPDPRDLIPNDRTCLLWLGLGDGHAVLIADYVDGRDPSRSRSILFFAPLEAIGSIDDPLTDLPDGLLPQRISVSREVIAIWTGSAIHAIDPMSGRIERLDGELPGLPQSLTVVGSHVLWEDWADLVRVAHADLMTTGSLFHRADPGDIKGFRTDGRDFAWFQGYDRQPDRSYARLELWTAPYVRDPATLEPRMVRLMEERGQSAYGGGWYVVLRGDPRRLDIVNIEDGTLRQWIPEGGVSTPPLYVSEHEILAQSGNLVRFDPHALPVVEE